MILATDERPDPALAARSIGGRVSSEPGPIALVGGDELKPGNEPQDDVLVKAAGSGPAFVVATAAAGQDPAAAVGNARRWFGTLGLEIEELPLRRRVDARSKRIAARARGGRFFYLVGGDPGLVPVVLAGTPVWSAIIEAWLGGSAVGASSAGAMALGAWTSSAGRVRLILLDDMLPRSTSSRARPSFPTSTRSVAAGPTRRWRRRRVPTRC